MQTTRGAPAKSNLLLCLDAFGTLFKPTRPIAATYAEAGARHGLPTGGAAGAEAVQQRFKKAFKGESSRNPIYGKATGLGAEKWWSNVSSKHAYELYYRAVDTKNDCATNLAFMYTILGSVAEHNVGNS
jgi:hypothetical protein